MFQTTNQPNDDVHGTVTTRNADILGFEQSEIVLTVLWHSKMVIYIMEI